MERLEQVAVTPFKRVSYTEGIEILTAEVAAGKATFEEPNIVWGMDLGSEHERYLAEVVFKGPIILYNYPKEIKSFYMRLNDDGKTVAAMDVLVPKARGTILSIKAEKNQKKIKTDHFFLSIFFSWQIGELVGGSQREDRHDLLLERIKEVGLDPGTYQWYLDLRRYGSVPHAGFGLGFERLVRRL